MFVCGTVCDTHGHYRIMLYSDMRLSQLKDNTGPAHSDQATIRPKQKGKISLIAYFNRPLGSTGRTPIKRLPDD